MQERITTIAMNWISAANTLTLPMDVWHIVKHNGYRIYCYSHGRDLLALFNLTELADRYPAVAAKVKQEYYIFLSDDLNIEQERWCLAHELGHIALGHLEGESPPCGKEEAEQQADRFALALLAPCPILEQCGVTSIADIRRCTGLSLRNSRLVFDAMEEYRLSLRETARMEDIARRAARARRLPGIRLPVIRFSRRRRPPSFGEGADGQPGNR